MEVNRVRVLPRLTLTGYGDGGKVIKISDKMGEMNG